MSKYYLNAMVNDKLILTITSGKLNDIDKFIFDNNIYNVEELYDYIKDNISECLKGDYIEFFIQYKYNGQIKTKPILFKKSLIDFKNCNNKSEYIYDLLRKDSKFKNKFDSKYINRILSVKKESSILLSARDYLYNFNFDNFDSLYHSLITKKINIDLSNRTFENSEDLENELSKKTYSYTMQRDMYFSAYFWNRDLPKSKIFVSNYEKEDEFDEEMMHDQNPDRYRIYGKLIEEMDTPDFDITVKKKKKLIKENPNQLSFISLE